MKTSEIIQLDCRDKDNAEIVQRVLWRIKPFKKYEGKKVPLQQIERVVKQLTEKTDTVIRCLAPDTKSNDTSIIWRCGIHDKNNFELVQNVYGISIYETLCKTTIYLYQKAKKG